MILRSKKAQMIPSGFAGPGKAVKDVAYTLTFSADGYATSQDASVAVDAAVFEAAIVGEDYDISIMAKKPA